MILNNPWRNVSQGTVIFLGELGRTEQMIPILWLEIVFKSTRARLENLYFELTEADSHFIQKPKLSSSETERHEWRWWCEEINKAGRYIVWSFSLVLSLLYTKIVTFEYLYVAVREPRFSCRSEVFPLIYNASSSSHHEKTSRYVWWKNVFDPDEDETSSSSYRQIHSKIILT